MKPYCNCRKLTGEKNETKYKETESKQDICVHCGVYVVWAKNEIELHKLLTPKEER